ncbi:hypothetical protein HNI00_07305 [Thermoleptolyngbya oregonensis NK1-22]|uniref:Uncharacterized protein n=1 Tax=Thermoleptolyngbya oregonensis NK1-22 TaxID=2547457 RepID=A0AA96Y8C1_9CYAN|nr:hypothetical protein [Thermoleptolyngbya oregonensis]WOB42983.1 hypothetical protein HNI00_07305 [Thermoleptolyngbya oregonensis NK1-22]
MVAKPQIKSFPFLPLLLLILVGTLVLSQPPTPEAAPPYTTAPMPMLDDPEAETSEWEEFVNAMSDAVARQKCRSLADYYSQTGGTRVIVTSVTPLKNGLYRCKFLGEVQGYDDDP